jgi:hypothetical protein
MTMIRCPLSVEVVSLFPIVFLPNLLADSVFNCPFSFFVRISRLRHLFSGSKSSLYSVYSQMKACVKDEEERRKRASPEWEGEMKRAARLVQSTGTSTNSALDHRAMVGKDLSMLTQNIHKLIESNHPVLHTVARYYFDQGGKHFRPLLVLLVSLATNRCLPRPTDEIFPPQKRLAEITEMIHTASLLHDDVIDIADTRRGRPSANVNYGNKIAVLVGLFLIFPFLFSVEFGLRFGVSSS